LGVAVLVLDQLVEFGLQALEKIRSVTINKGHVLHAVDATTDAKDDRGRGYDLPGLAVELSEQVLCAHVVVVILRLDKLRSGLDEVLGNGGILRC